MVSHPDINPDLVGGDGEAPSRGRGDGATSKTPVNAETIRIKLLCLALAARTRVQRNSEVHGFLPERRKRALKLFCNLGGRDLFPRKAFQFPNIVFAPGATLDFRFGFFCHLWSLFAKPIDPYLDGRRLIA